MADDTLPTLHWRTWKTDDDAKRAIDALIAAVRAEYRPEPCADHPTAEMVTVCEACIEAQIGTPASG